MVPIILYPLVLLWRQTVSVILATSNTQGFFSPLGLKTVSRLFHHSQVTLWETEAWKREGFTKGPTVLLVLLCTVLLSQMYSSPHFMAVTLISIYVDLIVVEGDGREAQRLIIVFLLNCTSCFCCHEFTGAQLRQSLAYKGFLFPALQITVAPNRDVQASCYGI